MKEPVSTYTNLAYAVAGLLLWDIILTPALILLCIASGGYHWTKTRTWQKLDVRAMFLVFGAIMWYHLGTWEAGVMISASVALTWVREGDFSTEVMMPYMFLIVSALAIPSTGWLFVPVFALAVLCNIPFLYLNWNKTLTDVLHGFWHLLTAYGLYLMV